MASFRDSDRESGELVVATDEGTVVCRVPAASRQQMQYLYSRLEVHSGGVPFSIGVTSSISGEGVSFVTNALGAVLAEDVGRRTCVVRANWWSGDEAVDGANGGLAGVLRGEINVETAIVPTRYAALSIMASGEVPALHRALLSKTEGMTAVLARLRDRFDHVLLDLPALSESASALTLGAAADASLLVVRQQTTQIDQVERAVDDLRHTSLLGVVMNDNHVALPKALQRRLLDA